MAHAAIVKKVELQFLLIDTDYSDQYRILLGQKY
jgi:hypothetical protein